MVATKLQTLALALLLLLLPNNHTATDNTTNTTTAATNTTTTTAVLLLLLLLQLPLDSRKIIRYHYGPNENSDDTHAAVESPGTTSTHTTFTMVAPGLSEFPCSGGWRIKKGVLSTW